MKKIYGIFLIFLFIGCMKEKMIYKRIETKNYFIEGYTHINGTDKIFPNELVLIEKITKDTIYKCRNCYKDFHIILEDTLLIYGGNRKDSIINNKIILKKIPTSYDYKYNNFWIE